MNSRKLRIIVTGEHIRRARQARRDRASLTERCAVAQALKDMGYECTVRPSRLTIYAPDRCWEAQPPPEMRDFITRHDQYLADMARCAPPSMTFYVDLQPV